MTYGAPPDTFGSLRLVVVRAGRSKAVRSGVEGRAHVGCENGGEMQLRQAELTWHVAGDEVVVLDLQGSVYLKLNGSARVLWERLATSCDEAELTAAILEVYDVSEDRAATDVAAFLTELRQRDLLED
jgi:hypothetical protein